MEILEELEPSIAFLNQRKLLPTKQVFLLQEPTQSDSIMLVTAMPDASLKMHVLQNVYTARGDFKQRFNSMFLFLEGMKKGVSYALNAFQNKANEVFEVEGDNVGNTVPESEADF